MKPTLLFDLDGTLINTNELIIASFTYTLDRFCPGQFTRQDIVGFIGEPLEDSFKKVSPESADEMVQVYRKHNIQHHDDLVTEFPNVYETIRTLSEKGYPIGIVTTKRRKTVDMGLKLTGLDAFFDVIVTMDDVNHAKPDSEPIDLALKQLGSSQACVYMIGDSPHDIQAGKHAGVNTIGVSWSVKGRDVISDQSPDYLIDDMYEILEIVRPHANEENEAL
ncbi:pyrophosphatase PpaX [Tuberibacillus sp. Marseille-P3662]|uniref:pyrophosphatase PpaX n=1 Tax=Tuberibacillus sp. Marseille-P3662 TaxID=1965358 RepID=UPI000A1CD63C|nr:pyrophosphatase PpaX [Tuberibacillus sp. Marseille-P3662]